jgi:hypothetical protein
MASDDEIRAAFYGIPPSPIDVPDGYVAVAELRLGESGIAPDKIRDFVAREGGQTMTTDPVRLDETNPDRPTSSPGSTFYVVPAALIG